MLHLLRPPVAAVVFVEIIETLMSFLEHRVQLKTMGSNV